MQNKKRVGLSTALPSIGCTVKGMIFFLKLLHESIKYWACKTRLYIFYIRYPLMNEYVYPEYIFTHWICANMQSHHADRLFQPLGPHHGFPERWTPTYYSVYNSQLEDTLNNKRCLPRPGFKPRTSSCGTRKESV